MSNPYFQFKQFTVWHDRCAMKVGTDGTLLGAWTDLRRSKTILDVGSGSGLVALMLAQRSEALIDAIDIDADAVTQTRINCEASPFATRIRAWHEPLQQFSEHPKRAGAYDLVVSNPPYFIDSLKCPDRQRNTARHTDTLPLDELFEGCRKLLAPHGHFALILPYDQREKLFETASLHTFFLWRETTVFSTPGAKPKRILADFSLEKSSSPLSDTLTIERSDHQFTDEFRALAKDFYLKL